MDSETAKERIADTIEGLIPDCSNRKAWLRTEALAMNMSYAMLRKYHGGEHECAAGAYLKMCAQWPGFHETVMGTTQVPPPDIAKLAAELQIALEAWGVRDNATVVAADFARRMGAK